MCGVRVTTYEMPEHPGVAAKRAERVLARVKAILTALSLPSTDDIKHARYRSGIES